MNLPSIHVMPFIGAKALYRIANLDPVAGDPFGTDKKNRDVHYPLDFAPIDEIFGDVAAQEAMFVCYRRRDSGPLPRLTKATEGHIDLVCDYGAFDVDLNLQFGEKGKLSWAKLGEERTAEIQGRIEHLLDLLTDHDAHPICYYRSKNGLRFVHLFHEPLTVAGLETAYARLAPLFAQAGIKVDPACFDWTRCFKVPRCTLEDGVVTSEQPWFHIEWFKDAVTLAHLPELTAQPTTRHAGEISAEARLEVSHAREAIEMDGKLTPDGLLANHALRGDPELHGICFGSAPFPAVRGDGTAHTTLVRLAGRLSGRLAGYRWATEKFLFGLLGPKVAELCAEDDQPLTSLWDMICTFLAGDRAQLAAKNAEVKAKVEEAATAPPSAQKLFADGVREWLPDAAGLDDAGVVDLVKRAHLAIATSRSSSQSFVLQPNGFYSSLPISPDKVALTIRENRMEWLVPLEYETVDAKNKARLVARTWAHFLNDDCHTFSTTRMLCVHRGNYLTRDEAGESQFIISPFWLADRGPKFNERVEEWLQLAARDGDAQDLVQALAYLLAFQFGPTAAVALIGPRSVGKKLIAHGLAECINTMQCCLGKVLVARFNDGLTKSPLVWIDEGLPKGKDGIDFADTFRNLVTGGKLVVERKGQETFEVAGVHRVLITANNYDAIAKLGEDAPRTQDDLDAISERLVVFELQKRAADFLGRTDTRGWIAGDNGDPSQFVIARHLLWHLFNTVQWEDGRPVKMGRRLLYEGKANGLVQKTIDSADPNVPEIALAVNDMIRAGKCHFRETGVYVHPDQLRGKVCGLQARVKPSDYRRAVKALAWDSHNTTIDSVTARWLVFGYTRLVDVVSQFTAIAPTLVDHLKTIQ